MNIEKFIKKWEKDRRKGKKNYVLMNGVKTTIGVLCGCIIGGMICDNAFTSDFYMTGLPLFCGCSIGGTIGAYKRWDRQEEKYNKLVNDELHK